MQFWIYIGATIVTINTIRPDDSFPFCSNPVLIYWHNKLARLNNSEFVWSAIQDLLIRSSIVECSTGSFVVNPLTVAVLFSGANV